MTPPPQPECDHFDVCHIVHTRWDHKCPSDPKQPTCDYDTRTRPAPAPDILTYEKCGKKYSCPDGEECWYLSQDYHWDCGQGAAKISKVREDIAAHARMDVLAALSAWRIRRMNGMLKKDVWKWWNDETDFIESLLQQQVPP